MRRDFLLRYGLAIIVVERGILGFISIEPNALALGNLN